MFFKRSVLKNFTICTGKHLRWSLFLIMLTVFIKNWLQRKWFSMKICEIFKSTSFYRTPPVSASVIYVNLFKFQAKFGYNSLVCWFWKKHFRLLCKINRNCGWKQFEVPWPRQKNDYEEKNMKKMKLKNALFANKTRTNSKWWFNQTANRIKNVIINR